MKRTIILYSLILAVLIITLKIIEYKFIVRDYSLEIYIGLIAIFFSGIGIWVGLKIMNRREKVQSNASVYNNVKPSISDAQKELNKFEDLSISKREYEVLLLIADGLSNQEIADKMFVSLSTIKTHSSKLFAKLDVKRRTQAVQKAKELKIIE